LGVIFQGNGLYTSHIQHVHDKCLKRMNALRLLKGTNWGAEKRPLNIYRSIIRPVIEYGMEAYFFSSKTSLAPLFKVQFEALRLCTGAMRSTPTICLQHSCGEMPLEIRHELLCMKYKAHLLTFLEHPTKTLISDSWQERFPDSSTFCSFNLFTKRFTPNSFFKLNLIYTPHIPVWQVLNPQIDFAVYNFAHQNPSTNYVPSHRI